MHTDAHRLTDERRVLRAEYDKLAKHLLKVITRHAPINLIEGGAPADEYELDVRDLLPKLRLASSAEELRRIAHQVFVHYFGEETAGPESLYHGISQEIWEHWQGSVLRGRV